MPKLTEEQKRAILIKTIKKLSDGEAVSLHNEYSYSNNASDDVIMDMDSFNEVMAGNEPSEIARSIFYGGHFNPNDDYFYFNGYGNVVSTDNPFSVIIPEDIADDVLRKDDAFECDDIQDLLDEWEEE